MQQILTAEPLRVEEFWPKQKPGGIREKKARYCKFDNLTVPVKDASSWLATHPAFQVLNVETAEKKVTYTKDVPRDVMQYKATSSSNIYMRGIRIWLTKGGHEHAQGFDDLHKLAFYDVLPERIDGLKYESLVTALEKYNQRAMKLPGKLLTIETVSMTMPRRILTYKGTKGLNPVHSRYTDIFDKLSAFFLRLWYMEGTPQIYQLGITDFKPKAYQGIRTETMLPVYAPFDSLYPKVEKWMAENKDLRVTNIQTLHSKYGTERESGPTRLNTIVGMEEKVAERPRVFYLRVAWFTSDADDVTTPTSPRGLVGYTFRPNITADKSGYSKVLYVRCEGLVRTVGRISARLETLAAEDPSSRGSIISSVGRPLWAQVLAYPQSLLDDPSRPSLNQLSTYRGDWIERNDDSNTDGDKIHMFYVVRVYMDQSYPSLQGEHFDKEFVKVEKECRLL